MQGSRRKAGPGGTRAGVTVPSTIQMIYDHWDEQQAHSDKTDWRRGGLFCLCGGWSHTLGRTADGITAMVVATKPPYVAQISLQTTYYSLGEVNIME